MRDKLEGSRPSDMPGVSLAKGRAVAVASAGGPLALPIAALLVALLVGALVWMLAGAPSGRSTAGTAKTAGAGAGGADVVMRHQAREAPEEVYESSAMERVVLAEYRPSTNDGDDSVDGRARLIGKGGIDMETHLPRDCENAPIEARVGRVILVRADVWRLRDGGRDKQLSEDDAKAALCGDFKGRDVRREPSPDRSPRQSEDPNVIEEK